MEDGRRGKVTAMRRGFTLIELVLVIGILSVLLFLILLVTTTAIGRGALRSGEDIVVQSLRRAQALSLQNVQGSPWGVYLCPGPAVPAPCIGARPSVILFKRSAFTLFDAPNDQVLEINPNIAFGGGLYTAMTATNGPIGIVFAQLTGEPTINGLPISTLTLTLTFGDETRTLTVSGKGVVEHEGG